MKTMQHNFSHYIGQILGGCASVLYVHFGNINWEIIVENLGTIVWLAFVGFLGGVGGKLGQLLVTWIIKKCKNQTQDHEHHI
jgi:hypothetical protein